MSKLHIRQGGSPHENHLPVVLLHGWSCHGGFFEGLMRNLRDETLLLAPDLPGHGKTGADVDLTIEAAADAVSDLLEERGLDRVVLVGWSMGAHVAYALIERHGTSRFASLVVEDMTPRVLNDDAWHLGTKNGNNAIINLQLINTIETQWPLLAEAVAKGILAEGLEPDADLLAFNRREMLAANPTQIAAMWASLTAQDFRPLLAKIDIPVHLARGARSPLYGRNVAEWQAERLADATIHEFPRSGHAPHMEEPEAFTDFLRSLIAVR